MQNILQESMKNHIFIATAVNLNKKFASFIPTIETGSSHLNTLSFVAFSKSPKGIERRLV